MDPIPMNQDPQPKIVIMIKNYEDKFWTWKPNGPFQFFDLSQGSKILEPQFLLI